MKLGRRIRYNHWNIGQQIWTILLGENKLITIKPEIWTIANEGLTFKLNRQMAGIKRNSNATRNF